jgi:phosphoribosyl 1,2-cyclic phosphate phosphodiesterase
VLKVTFLGTGTSQGVPVIGCSCEVCLSNDLRDKRLRCSVLVEIQGKNYVIDTGPDFRQQMLKENVQSLDGVLFTHEHKDHLAGLDDVRPFNFRQNKDMPIYCNERVEEAIRREFHYVFSDNPYPGIPKLALESIDINPFFLPCGTEVIPIEVMHFKMPVLGFRIGDFTYITDAKTIATEEKKKVKGSKILVVNALQFSSHISHFNLEEALHFIDEVRPQHAYLTHLSHHMGKHDELLKRLPEHVSVGYDGLKIEV